MRRISRVVAGASGSPGSLAALRFAACLAWAVGVPLVPVLVWQPPSVDWAAVYGQQSDCLDPAWRAKANARLAGVLTAAWGGGESDLLVRPYVERGLAGQVLVEFASAPGDVLVIGAGRRHRRRLGSGRTVSRYCVARADCPVVLIPPPQLLRHPRLARRLRRRPVTVADFVPGAR